MKKTLVVVTMLMLVVGLIAGCGGKDAATPGKSGANAPKTDFPNKPITIIVGYAAGGGTDLGARVLVPLLEKELGVPVVVENKPGASAWIAYSEVLKAKPDGYTLGYFNTPSFVFGELNPANKRPSYESFDFIANHVIDPAVIAIRVDDKRFATAKDFVEYAKTNTVTATTNGVGSSNHIAIMTMNDKLGTKIKPVHFGGTGEALTAVMGGHVDVLICKVGEILEPVKDGTFKVLAVATKERAKQLPDVPTFKEATGSEVINYTTRGIGAPKGLDPQVMAKLQAAVEKAMKNPEHIQRMEKMGLVVDGRKGEEYKKLIAEEEKALAAVAHLLGWKK